MDVLLIKEMNMNAVRCSHYPPDKEFLDYCDSLGLYVIDELAGWHNAYDTVVGEKLVREMVIRDVNHPSILFWSNGNEGGHNKDLIDDYAIYDPSIRPVIHAHHRPGNAINGIECNHYPSYWGMQNTLKDPLIYMTTEFLHCQNDGGGGAGLNDYWNLMLTSEKSGGGFLWALLDEGIVRTDRNNIIDVNGVNAPDGVLGPHREKEGSFYAIREIFTPIYIPVVTIDVSVIDTIPIENRFEFTNLSACQFKWKLVDFHSLFDYSPGYSVEVEGIFNGSNIKPGEKGNLRIPLPENFLDYDALVLEAYDPYRNQVMNWSWKIESNKEIVKQFRSEAVLGPSMVEEADTTLSITVNKITIVLSKLDGSLLQIKNHRNRFQNFGNGPKLVAGVSKFESLEHYSEEDGYVAEIQYSGNLKFARWKMCEDGWVELDYEYSLSGEHNFSGISFDFPEDHVMSVKWLGNGPYRVWKNRMCGGTINVWENTYNNTQTGYYPWLYPEFKGYYSNISWMELNTVEGKFLFATDADNLYVRLFDFYSLPGLVSHPQLPEGDISFLEHIPPTGTKMSTKINSMPEKLGPESEINKVDGTYNRTLYFYFGMFD
ncbi:Beta-galactosidase [subsurface metagenome]